MPLYGFRGIYLAEYHNNNGAVTYDAPFTPGCPIMANLEFQFAQGDLWCKDARSITRRKIIGGNVTFETKALSQAAQLAMFGAASKTRSVTYTEGSGSQTKNVSSVVFADTDNAPCMGFAGYGPDAIDEGSDKFTAFFIPKARFSPPSMRLQTINSNITFQTPTTTGTFMHDDTSGLVVAEFAVCDSEAEAQAWCAAVFPQAQGG